MKINVLSVSEDAREFSYELPPDELALDTDIQLRGPVGVSGELYRIGTKLVIRGMVSAVLGMTCSRCLAEMEAPLRTRLEVIAVPDTEVEKMALGSDPAGAEDVADTFLGYENDQLDLLPEIRSLLILAIPMRPLCAENCPGLCPQCGLRLSEGHQHLETKEKDNPFARLKIWLSKPSEKR